MSIRGQTSASFINKVSAEDYLKTRQLINLLEQADCKYYREGRGQLEIRKMSEVRCQRSAGNKKDVRDQMSEVSKKKTKHPAHSLPFRILNF